MVLDEMLQDINHDQKGMKNFDGVFLVRKFDSGSLYTKPKKPESAFFFKESMVYPSVQLELKKRHFELTIEESLMIN